jgi:nucleotide-binding universal stress UspA family protein
LLQRLHRLSQPEDAMIKNLVVNLSTTTGDNATADYAISIAREFDAHLSAVAFAYDAVPVAMVIDGVPPAWFDDMQQEAEDAAKAAVAKFNEAARVAGISAQARWLSASFAGTGDVFGRIARRFDLSVVRQAEPGKDTPDPLIIEAALFDSGRPLVIVPYIQRSGIKLDRVMVCWDGSRSAARAVGDAMPFLVRAKAVQVAVVGHAVKSNELPGADIAHHLARHNVSVEVKEIVATDIDAANVLLSHAADTATDFIVMGAYGHSRLREFVLGGVTRSMLATMTVPTLMSH